MQILRRCKSWNRVRNLIPLWKILPSSFTLSCGVCRVNHLGGDPRRSDARSAIRCTRAVTVLVEALPFPVQRELPNHAQLQSRTMKPGRRSNLTGNPRKARFAGPEDSVGLRQMGRTDERLLGRTTNAIEGPNFVRNHVNSGYRFSGGSA